MGSGFAKQKKQARMMQEQLLAMQQQLKEATATGTAGGGLVTCTLNGDNEMTTLKIKPECVDPEDVEALEDLIRAAYTDALNQLKEKSPVPSFPGMPDLASLGF